jgi:PAS domain S-box-containing protein
MDANADERHTRSLTHSDRPNQESSLPTRRPSLLRRSWHGVHQWAADRTLAASWLPSWLRHTWVGYLVGFIVVGALFIVLPDLLVYISVIPLPVVLLLLTTTITALAWGAGPGLVVTLSGSAVLDHFEWTPHLAMVSLGSALAVEDLFVLLIGALISLLIGENTRAHRNSEQSRQLLDTVLEAQPAGVALSDARGTPVRFNAAFKRIWSDETLQQTDRDWQAVFQAMSPTGSLWPLARALTRGETSHGEETEIIALDGQRKVILTAAAPIRVGCGTVVGGVVTEMDITDQKRLEEALRRSKRQVEVHAAQLETILQTIVDGVIVTDAEGNIQVMNQAAMRHHGINRNLDELAGPFVKWTELGSIQDAQGRQLPDNEQPIARLLRGEVLTGEQEVDLHLQRQHGHGVVISAHGAPIRDETGAIVGAVEISRDVTEQRRREQQSRNALHALLALAEALVLPGELPQEAGEATPVGSNMAIQRFADLIQDMFGCEHVHIGTVDAVTDKYTPVAMVGFSPEEKCWRWSLLQGSSVQTYFTPEQCADLHAGKSIVVDPTPNAQVAKEAALTNTVRALVVPLLQDEQLIGLLGLTYVQEAPLYGQETHALVHATANLATTILEHGRLLREREEARASSLALQETNEQMDAFMGMVSHELKTPLTSLVLALQMTQRRLRNFVQNSSARPQDVVGYVEGVREQLIKPEQQTKKLDRMVDDLLDLTRLRSGHLQLNPVLTDLVEITRQAVEEQCQVARGRSIQLHAPEDRPVQILADAVRIGQVITNYLTNALKYSPADQPVEVGVEVKGPFARVWVRDYGPGLHEGEQEHIWDRFHRVPGIEVQSGSGVGLGLGLSISRDIVTLHGGQVGVESSAGQGSCFWLALPVATAHVD